MHKWMSAVLGLALLLWGISGALAANQGGAWKLVSQSEVKHAVNMAGFFNEQNGVTIGYAGEIHYTHDGGKTWPQAVNNSWCRFGLEILNDKTAWNCGNKGHVRLTTDGGENWTAVADFGEMEPNQCRFLSFSDANTGWIASPYRVAATTDGAKSWKEFSPPDDCNDIAAIHLLNANVGYLLDIKGKLSITQDAGKTWSTQTIPFKGAQSQTLKCPTAALRFTDVNHGIALVAAKGAVNAYTTADAGKTWSESPVTDKLFGYLFLTRDGKTLTVTGTRDGNPLISVFALK